MQNTVPELNAFKFEFLPPWTCPLKIYDNLFCFMFE